jgi:hypothetical protein
MVMDMLVPVDSFANFLINCSENARLRECLLDSTLQSILVALLNKNIDGVIIGKFLSDTGMSIKELKNFSTDGTSLKKIYDHQDSALFLLFFINGGLKVTDMGNVIRQGLMAKSRRFFLD